MFPKITLFIAFLFPAITSFATDFYVATNGSDAFPGTLAQPWKTIQHACDNATPGSTVYIKAGTYFEELWMNVSGTAGNAITFTHYANDVVTIDGNSTNTQKVLLTISGQNYIRIQGLHFANAIGNFSSGITVSNGSQHIQLLDNQIHDIHFSSNPAAPVTPSTNTNPLVVYGDHPVTPIFDVTVSGNKIYNCHTGYSEALTVNGNVDGFTITGNSVYNITNIGIDLAGGYAVCSDPAKDAARHGTVTNNTVFGCVSGVAVAAGIYVDGGRSITIEHNTVHNCGRGFEVGCENPGKTADSITVRNNVAYYNLEAGIGIGGYDYPNTGKVINARVLNNTFYGNVTTQNGDGELLVEYTENSTVRNNLFYTFNSDGLLLVTRLNSTGLSLDYNMYYDPNSSPGKVDFEGTIYNSFANYKSSTGQDAHSTLLDPQLDVAGTQDFHVSANSPARNAGDPAFVPAPNETDLDGENRVQQNRVDIGVDELPMPPLAVSWLAFYGQALPEAVVLRWSTGAEQNNARFDILRGSDPFSFEKIGEIAGHGNMAIQQDYVFPDKNPLDGINYYRLQQVDYDGKSTFSKIVSFEFKTLVINIFPNPVTEGFDIQCEAGWEKAVLKNVLGQTVREFSFGEQTTLGGCLPGVYMLEVFVGKNGQKQMVRLKHY